VLLTGGTAAARTAATASRSGTPIAFVGIAVVVDVADDEVDCLLSSLASSNAPRAYLITIIML
jgi:hypothetical protein